MIASISMGDWTLGFLMALAVLGFGRAVYHALTRGKRQRMAREIAATQRRIEAFDRYLVADAVGRTAKVYVR